MVTRIGRERGTADIAKSETETCNRQNRNQRHNNTQLGSEKAYSRKDPNLVSRKRQRQRQTYTCTRQKERKKTRTYTDTGNFELVQVIHTYEDKVKGCYKRQTT